MIAFAWHWHWYCYGGARLGGGESFAYRIDFRSLVRQQMMIMRINESNEMDSVRMVAGEGVTRQSSAKWVSTHFITSSLNLNRKSNFVSVLRHDCPQFSLINAAVHVLHLDFVGTYSELFPWAKCNTYHYGLWMETYTRISPLEKSRHSRFEKSDFRKSPRFSNAFVWHSLNWIHSAP